MIDLDQHEPAFVRNLKTKFPVRLCGTKQEVDEYLKHTPHESLIVEAENDGQKTVTTII